MGLRCNHFVPRMCEARLRVFSPGQTRTADEPNNEGDLMFEQAIKIRRVTLISREPTYSLGVAFIDPTPDLDRRIDELFARLQGSQACGVVKRVGETGGSHA
jgi:hypothetical protein